MAGDVTVDVVRGSLEEGLSNEILGLWESHGALSGEAARERLGEVVCVARAGDEIVGVNSVARDTPEPPSRPLWLYRSFAPDAGPELKAQLFTAAFETLQAEFDRDPSGPLGVCHLVADAEEREARPEAVWRPEGLLYAGYTEDGRQIRLRWFWRAPTEPPLPNSPGQDEALETDYSIGDRYRVEPYRGEAEIADQILAMWAREQVVPAEEAQRRVHEALNVVIDRDEGVVAVSTAYLQRSTQLAMDLWYFRTFVSTAHRHTHVATQLTFHNRDLLESRYENGEDRRGAGVVFELENEGMRKYFNLAIWKPAMFWFVGDNERGIPVRVHYFPGATVPPPPR